MLKSLSHTLLNTLRARLVLFVVAAVAVTSGVAAAIQHAIHEDRLQEEALARYDLLADQTSELIHQGMRQGGRHTVDAVLQAVGRHRGLASLRVLDASGHVHFSSRSGELGETLHAFDATQLRPAMPRVTLQRADGRTLATVTEALPADGNCAACHTGDRSPGIFQLRLDVTAEDADLAAGWRRLVMGLAVAQVFLFVLLWALFKRLLVRPVRRLMGSMRQAAAGDLEQRIDLPVPRELEGVVEQYNAMLEELAEARAEIDRYYQDSLARADRLATVGEMATAMAHEIQNPLAGLSGALRVMRKDPAMAHRRDVVDEMLATLNRLSNTTSDLLAYARPADPDFAAVDVNRVAGSVVLFLKQQQEGQQERQQEGLDAGARVRLREDLDPRLPAAWTDDQQLRQVLINVCLNALQALGNGPGEVVVRTRAVAEGAVPHVRLEVVDDGPGIPPEVLDQVFRPFFTTKPRGTGLGLAITRRIVERAGGCIRILSEVGAGTTVRLELPGAAVPTRIVECERLDEPALAVGGD